MHLYMIIFLLNRLQSIQKKHLNTKEITLTYVPNHKLIYSHILQHTKTYPKISKHTNTTQAQNTTAVYLEYIVISNFVRSSLYIQYTKNLAVKKSLNLSLYVQYTFII